MKSHPNAGQFNLRGKRSITLPCGCCDAFDKREAYERALWHRTLADVLRDSRPSTVALDGQPLAWSK